MAAKLKILVEAGYSVYVDNILLKGLLAPGFFHLSQKRPYVERTIKLSKTVKSPIKLTQTTKRLIICPG